MEGCERCIVRLRDGGDSGEKRQVCAWICTYNLSLS